MTELINLLFKLRILLIVFQAICIIYIIFLIRWEIYNKHLTDKLKFSYTMLGIFLIQINSYCIYINLTQLF